MRIKVLFFCVALLLARTSPAAAATEMLFREDSGLTKTEYLLSVGQYTAALDTANDVLKRHPDNADAFTYRGYAYYRLGEMAEAEKNFRMALKLNPVHLGANKYLASIYLDKGDVSRALEQLQVIRMTCGRTDCEELSALQREIDQYKAGKSTTSVKTEEPAPSGK